MAIQMRRGSAADFDGSRLEPGELAVCVDTDELYYKGTDAVKVATDEKSRCYVVSIASFSSLPKTVTDSNITSDMVVVESEIGTPNAMLSNWTWTTSNGSVTISGTISGSTTLKLYLLPSR